MEVPQVLKAVILVGGPSKGTRFRPLSLEMPKPLFPIGDKPMIEHHIEACSQLPGMTEIMLLGFEEEPAFRPFIEEMEKRYKVKLTYLEETSELGTAGGLNKFQSHILSGSPDAFFVLHCDVCCNFRKQLPAMLEFHRSKVKSHGAVATLMGSKVKPEYASHYGCLVEDEQHLLTHYAEKPVTFVSDLINSGIYCFHPKIFDFIGEVVTKKKELEEGEEEDFLRLSLTELLRSKNNYRLEQEIFIPLSEKKLLYVFRNEDFWKQVKNAGAAVYCSDLVLGMYAKNENPILAKKNPGHIIGNVLIHPTAQVDPSAVLGPNVTIGPNVKVGKGVRILHSIILDGAEIKDHACILYSIIGWECIVGHWARIEGIPNPTPDIYIEKVRVGICIVGRGSVAAPEVMIRNCLVMPHKTLADSYCDEILL